jgi:TolB-like protein/Flp pilus assembly protein TadD
MAVTGGRESAQLLYHFSDHALDTDRRELRRGRTRVPIEPQVFDLLIYLIQNRERVVSKDDLIGAVWNGRAISESAFSSRINSARNAVGDDGEKQRLIQTFPRKGFRFVGVVHEVGNSVEQSRDDVALKQSPPLSASSLDKPSIAVLSFTNMSGDPQQDYFADGMAEDITTALSKVRWFLVTSRNSSFVYKGKPIDIKQAAHQLGVRYVLEGSVRKVGARVRITAQLLDASGHHVWAERYDRDLADVFAVQDEITERVVAAIEPQLYAAEGIRTKRKPPESFDAWECVVRALALLNSRARVDVEAARELLRKAVTLDPGYGQAHSLLSFAITLGVHMGWDPRESALALASDGARRALFLDTDDPWAHVALGYVLAWSARADEAIAEYQKALALNPNFAVAHWLLALALCYLGRAEEALTHGDQAERLSPRDLFARGNAGVSNNVRAIACFIAGRYREGITFARRAIIESPNLIPAHRALVVNCALAGDLAEAKLSLQSLQRLIPALSLKSIDGVMPYVRDDDRNRYLKGFRLAGLE